MDDIIPAEGQLYHKHSLYCRVDNSYDPGVADSHIPVKGHHAQEHTLCCPHGQAKEHLQCTAREGDLLSFQEEAHQCGGNGGGGVADVQGGEVPRKKYTAV